MYVVDQALARRVEASEAAHWASLVEALAAMPGNPYGAEVRRFGSVVALAVPGMPDRGLINRVMCAGPGDEEALEQGVGFLREVGVRVRLDVAPLHAGEPFLKRLAEKGFHQLGFQMALFGEAARVSPAPLPPGVEIRLAETDEEIEFAARTVPVVFDSGGEWVRWLGDSLRVVARHPEWRTYIAYVDGNPAGVAQLHMADGVGSLALAGTLEQFRGRGAQTALIHRRIADALAAGCDLICSQTGNGTVSQNNMERVGLRIAYTKGEFYDSLG